MKADAPGCWCEPRPVRVCIACASRNGTVCVAGAACDNPSTEMHNSVAHRRRWHKHVIPLVRFFLITGPRVGASLEGICQPRVWTMTTEAPRCAPCPLCRAPAAAAAAARAVAGACEGVPRAPAHVSARILGRRTAPFPSFLIPNRVPHGVIPRS